MNENKPILSSTKQETGKGWYIVHTLNLKEKDVADFMQSKDLHCFYPQTMVKKVVKERQVKVLVPAIHNMLFVQRLLSKKAFVKTCIECPWPAYCQKKLESDDLYVIPDNQMTEFRMMCDPSFMGSQFFTAKDVEAKEGRNVRIIHGPLKGILGQLVRVKNAYFVVKTLAGVGVMVRISRWYCEVLPDEQKQKS